MKMTTGMKPNRWELLKGYFKQGYMDSDTHLLSAWANARKLTKNQRVSLSLIYSTCYNVPTAVFIYHLVEELGMTAQEVWDMYKPALIFQTDRKWVKINGSFAQLMSSFETLKPYSNWLKPLLKADNPFDAVYDSFTQLKGQGRVSAYILLDGLQVTGVMKPCCATQFDWQNGQTVTEGMFMALGMDEEAEQFKKGKHRLTQHEIAILNQGLERLMSELEDEGERADNILDYESNLCAYRKYFKGSMYYGYYMDRQLEELIKLQRNISGYDFLWDELFALRKAIYPANLLGEVSGWNGIRKHRFDEFLRTGDISYE